MEAYNRDQLYNRNVILYLESSPNPNSLKFVANFMLVPEGLSFDFPDKESAKDSSLALELFNFDYIKRVFIMSNFITVTKDENVDWDIVEKEIKTLIHGYLESEQAVINENATPSNQIEEDDPETVKKIKVILDEYVKPAVEQDGGAIIFDSFNDGIVKLQLQGSCSGCPSSTITLKAGIENLLKSMMPEVQSVEAESI